MVLLEVTEAINHIHPVWNNVFFYLFVLVFLVAGTGIMAVMRALKKKTLESQLAEQQHAARIDVIRKENEEKLESLRVEMLKREEDRGRQWMESEKETLHVLNGVSNLLELSDKVDKVEFKNLNRALTAFADKIVSEKKLVGEL